MDGSERTRHFIVDRGSPLAQPGRTMMSDLRSKNTGKIGRQSPLQNPPSRISPSLSPGLTPQHPPGLPEPVAPQFGGYPMFETHPSMFAHPPGYFQTPPSYFQAPPPAQLYQNDYGQGHFGGCGGLGGELDGVYSYVNMGMTPQGPPQGHLDSRFPPFAGRQNSMEEVVPNSLSDGKRLKIGEPTIESIVGSLGTSNTPGTYTHFGPTNPLLTGLGVGAKQINDVEQYQHQLEFQMQQQWQNQFDFNQHKEDLPGQVIGHTEVTPIKSRSPGLGQKFVNGGAGDTFITTMQGGGANVIGSGKLSPVSIDDSSRATQMPRSITPNGLTSSYSACLKETGSSSNTGELEAASLKSTSSVKPSYLEILTKNNLPNGTTQTFRRTSSSSSSEQNHSANSVGDSDVIIPKRDSPTLTANSNGHHIQPLLQLHIQGVGMAHRKSSDGGGVVVNSSPGTSNSSTASSSPITKPKAQQRGKENNLSAFTKASKPPSFASNVTPVRSVTDKKGQNNGSAKKAAGKPSKGHKYDFEIDDPDDDSFEEPTGLDPDADEKSSKKKGKDRKNVASPTNGNVSLNGRNGVEKFNSSLGFGVPFGKKAGREKEKPRSRKEERNCLVRRFRVTSKLWLGHLISALTWLWSLVLNVATLSAAVGYGLSEDMYVWWTVRALPWLQLKQRIMKSHLTSLWQRFKWKEWMYFKRKEPQRKTEEIEDLSDLLAMLGPEKNILLPATGDEALRRLQSVKGQDPYSILGVRSNSPDETIRRYYKKQAVLVHPDKNLVPGAEEAFKILARAFELVGDPVRRMEYHKQLLEAHAKERFMGEFGSLFEQLRKKLESACTTIRCTKCNARHKKNKTNRPLFAARYCSQCRIHHGAREGELWAEKGGMFGFWTYYACMGNQVWEINEWGKCQSESLKHLSANAHNVLYRLVSGGQSQRQSRQSSQSSSSPPGEAPEDLLDPEIDDWDNLINNLCRGTASGSNSSSTAQCQKGSTSTAANAHGNAATSNAPTGSAAAAAGRKRKGKRK